MPKVSIIVPVYNSEKYLKTCLDSLVRGTLEDVEIILIDERLTTVEAHKTMNFLNISGKKKKNIVDTIAAVYILENYINSQKA